jgi:hypothetical protein
LTAARYMAAMSRTNQSKSQMPVIIPIDQRALMARLKRRLDEEGKFLRADRRGRGASYMLIDKKKGAIIATGVDLEKLARGVGALESWERLGA